jgi:hypothetical protein
MPSCRCFFFFLFEKKNRRGEASGQRMCYSRFLQTCRLRGFTFTFSVRIIVQFLYQDDHVRYKNWTIIRTLNVKVNHVRYKNWTIIRTLNVKVNPRRRHVCHNLLYQSQWGFRNSCLWITVLFGPFQGQTLMWDRNYQNLKVSHMYCGSTS